MASFKIADGHVEIHGEVDENQIRRAASRAGDQSGDHFTRAMGRRVKLFAEGNSFTELHRGAGRRSAGRWLTGFTAGLLKPNPQILATLRTGVAGWMASPLGLAGGAVALIWVASFISAIISSGVSALLGGLFIGLGALALRENEQIQAAFTRTGRRIDSAFTESAAGLIEPFLEAADDIGDGFVTRIAPRLRSIFDDIAPAVGPLVEGVIGTVESLLAKIQPHMTELTRDFLIPFSAQLPRLGESLGNFLATILRNGPAVAKAFEAVVDTVIFLVDVMDDIVIVGTKAFAVFNELIPMLGGMSGQLFKLSAETNGSADAFSKMLPPLTQFAFAVGMFEETGSRAARFFDDRFRPSIGGLTAATDSFVTQQELANTSMAAAITNAGGLSDALDILSGGALAARAAERQFQQAIDDANALLKEHGLTLDVSTEKGRNLEGALDAIAQAAIDEASRVFESTRQTDGLRSAQEAATGVLQRGRETLIDMLEPFFDNREAARKYVDEILQIPKEWETHLSNNANSARSAINRYREAIEAVPSFKRTTLLRQLITQDFGVNAPLPERFGGIHQAQHGLLSTSRMFRGNRTLFAFAEPETGGEAFIARNAPRERSLDILSEAARWHRAVVMPMERAATTMAAGAGAGPTQTARPVNNVNVRVFVGDRELTDIVDVRIEDHENTRSTREFMGAGLAR